MDNKTEIITLGMGCFWCTESIFKRLKGVKKVSSGFSGGNMANPSSDDVYSGTTGHIEVAQIEFDPEEISLEKILYVFWRLHNPTSLDKQGADVGEQYRSVIFYHDSSQKESAEKSKLEAQKMFAEKIVTDIVPLKNFYPAEAYHQDFYNKNVNSPYCTYVIDPKIEKLKKIFNDPITS